MKILVTNDDGYLALGIITLANAARTLGDVYVVAPDREQSATSHSLTMHHPLRVRQVGENIQTVDGTPTDCVLLALSELIGGMPDLVLSGINHGPNLGDDVLYSGTVAAAMEATVFGVPSIAISYAGRDAENLPQWEGTLCRLLQQLAGRTGFPRDTLLNVNLPPIAPQDVLGVRVTTLGHREYEDSITKALDPNGREYYWIGGGAPRWWGSELSDFRAIASNYVSVTPLHLDLTNYKLLEEISGWNLGL